MKKLPLFAVILLSACQKNDGKDFSWRILKSPLTGRCYEVAQVSLPWANNYAFGLSEVSCDLLDANKGVDK